MQVYARVLATLLILGAAAVSSATDHPVAGDLLRLKDPSNPNARGARFVAARDTAIDPSLAPDPTVSGGTIEITGDGVGDGSSGVVNLPAGRWIGLGNPAGSKGYKYIDPNKTDGVKKVLFKPGPNGGKIVVVAVGTNWQYLVTQSQGSVEVDLVIGGTDHYCAEFSSYIRNEVGLVLSRNSTPPNFCVTPVCGNGTTEFGEQCDDGGTTPGDGCDASCQLEMVCGDGFAIGTEECDDGGTSPGDGCDATCQLENTSAVCDGVSTTPGTNIASVLVASGFDNPVHVTAPRLDPNRLFVVEQAGVIRIIKNGSVLGTPFLDITSKIQCAPSCGEQGLLSMSFHPDYENNGWFFVDYTNTSGNTTIARYQVSGDPDIADDTSENILRTITQDFSNHNGGQTAFGPDGYLYVGMGDGGNGGDPNERAQDPTQLLGKMLRFDVDVVGSPFYAVPPSNPNAGAGDPLGLIWALGMRNPWRFSFDRANGDLYIGDVGQSNLEEVDYQPASSTGGENYGWDVFEASACYDPMPHFATCGMAMAQMTFPVHEYNHGQGCSITGGFVYRGCRMPDLHGTYFYSDYCSAFIRTFEISGGNATNHQDRTTDLDPPGPDTINSVASFGEDARGEIYIVSQGGDIYKIVPQ